jgi:hypothetical protein
MEMRAVKAKSIKILLGCILTLLILSIPVVYFLAFLPRIEQERLKIEEQRLKSSDTDEDGLCDWDEIMIHHSDPRNPDTDSDGIPDGQEVNLGLSPVAASIFPFLLDQRKAVLGAISALATVEGDLESYLEYDYSDMNRTLLSIERLASAWPNLQRNSVLSMKEISVLQTTARKSLAFFEAVAPAWTMQKITETTVIARVKEYNIAEIAKAFLDYGVADRTLFWHINEMTETELSRVNKGEHSSMGRIVTLLREAIGAGNRCRQILLAASMMFNRTLRGADLFGKYAHLSKDEWSVPGYIIFIESQGVARELLRQLRLHLRASGLEKERAIDITCLGSLANRSYEFNIQPRDRPTMQRILGYIDTETGQALRRILEADNSSLGMLQWNDVLDESSGYESNVALVIKASIRRGATDLETLCRILNDVVGPSHKGGAEDKYYSKQYQLVPPDWERTSALDLARKIYSNIESQKFSFSGYVISSIKTMWEAHSAGGISSDILLSDALTLVGVEVRTAYLYTFIGGGRELVRGRRPMVLDENSKDWYLLWTPSPIKTESWSGFGRFSGIITQFVPFLDGNIPILIFEGTT